MYRYYTPEESLCLYLKRHRSKMVWEGILRQIAGQKVKEKESFSNIRSFKAKTQ